MAEPLCKTCSFDYYKSIFEFYNNDEKSVNFLRCHGILPSAVSCPRCLCKCKLEKYNSRWRCYKKKGGPCNFSVSDNNGSFLANVRIPPWKLVLFVNDFLSNLWDQKTLTENLNLSTSSYLHWRALCCEVIDDWFSNQESIGGEGIEVEINETLVFQRRIRHRIEKGSKQIWLFGGVERDSKRRFVVALTGSISEKGDKLTLFNLIQKYIKPGSIIYCNNWAEHKEICDSGYKQLIVNPSVLDEYNSPLHIQNIEFFLGDVKEFLKKPFTRVEFLYQELARYLFISSVDNEQHLLHMFFIQAAKLYPPLSDNKQSTFNLKIENFDSESEDL